MEIISRNGPLGKLTKEDINNIGLDYNLFSVKGLKRKYTVKELALKYGVSRQTIHRWIRKLKS